MTIPLKDMTPDEKAEAFMKAHQKLLDKFDMSIHVAVSTRAVEVEGSVAFVLVPEVKFSPR
jgi:hypothetical protein